MWLSDANKQEGFKKENMVRGQMILRDEVKKEACLLVVLTWPAQSCLRERGIKKPK